MRIFINTLIHIGLDLNEESSNAQKKNSRKARSEIGMGVYNLCRKDATTPITFNEEDEVTRLHEDPLVMFLKVRPCDICHI